MRTGCSYIAIAIMAWGLAAFFDGGILDEIYGTAAVLCGLLGVFAASSKDGGMLGTFYWVLGGMVVSTAGYGLVLASEVLGWLDWGKYGSNIVLWYAQRERERERRFPLSLRVYV